MSMPKNKTTIHVYMDKRIVEVFQQAYPHCRNRFIENAMRLALSDKNLFDRIFFYDILNNGVQ